jgi:hypothetical protein
MLKLVLWRAIYLIQNTRRSLIAIFWDVALFLTRRHASLVTTMKTSNLTREITLATYKGQIKFIH